MGPRTTIGARPGDNNHQAQGDDTDGPGRSTTGKSFELGQRQPQCPQDEANSQTHAGQQAGLTVIDTVVGNTYDPQDQGYQCDGAESVSLHAN